MVDFQKLKEEQSKLAKKTITKDNFDKLDTIGGVDQAYHGEKVISAIVVCDDRTNTILEKVYAIADAKIPYVPGFLSYREGPAIGAAYSKLENKPDILIFDGNGILHPLRCGIATHMGVLLNQPSIGVAKELLLGEQKNGKIIVEKETRAVELITREKSKPVYISPGHKVSLKTSVEIVKKLLVFPHKLPEPLHLAHKYANEIRAKILSGEIKI